MYVCKYIKVPNLFWLPKRFPSVSFAIFVLFCLKDIFLKFDCSRSGSFTLFHFCHYITHSRRSIALKNGKVLCLNFFCRIMNLGIFIPFLSSLFSYLINFV